MLRLSLPPPAPSAHAFIPFGASPHAYPHARMPDSEPHITLEPIAGPALHDADGPIRVASTQLIGRATGSDLQLPDATVSRRHAEIAPEDGLWSLRDLGSRHGTFVNGNRLDPETPHPLSNRDQVRVGPWVFRVRAPSRVAGPSHYASIADDLPMRSTRVQAVPALELRSLAQQRLDVLIDCAARINAAADLDALAGVALESVIAGAGFARAAMVRTPDDDGQAEILAFRSTLPERAGELELSRSLLDAAARGQVARLTSDGPGDAAQYGQSIVQLGIHSALCAPVHVGDEVEALMYLDARGSENAVRHDAAAFCQAISRLCGLALANIRRQDLELEQRRVETELDAAREAQRLIMPAPSGSRGWHTYAMEMTPGRVVAGDLFDVVALTDDPAGPIACFLGDVTGKGVGAAITMATVQTHLRVALRHNHDPAAVVREVNAHAAARLTGGKFISLWLGVMDPAAGVVRFVDAGHGHWLIRHPGGPPARVECVGGLPIGIDPAYEYHTETVPFGPGSRLILFSDGLIEQPDREGRLFGLERALAAVTPATTAEQDVRLLVHAVHDHAGDIPLADDLTVASNEFRPA